MGYVEDIQKINRLAKEMLSHGIATSLDQAVIRAQETLRQNGSINIDLSDMNRTIEENNAKKTEVLGEIKIDPHLGTEIVNKPTQEEQKSQSSDFSWQDAMSKNTKYIVGQFNEMKNFLTEMTNEIVELKKEVTLLKRAKASFEYPRANEQVINIDDGPQPVAQQVQQMKQPVQQKPEPHPRQGNYAPGDISIQDVFYCGSKPRS